MKKYLAAIFLALFIIPSVALASWWNPFTWFNNWNFNKTETTSIKEESSNKIEDSNTKKDTDAKQNKNDNKSQNEIISSKTEGVSVTTFNKESVKPKIESTEFSSINNLEGARISTSKLNYIQGENIVVNIELPEEKFISCQFALIDPNGENISMGEGGCLAGVRTDFDSRYMQEPIDSYIPKGEVMSFISSGISNGIEYGRLGDNFGIWTLRILVEKSSGSKHLLETKFDYEENSSKFKAVILNNVEPIQKKVTREELVKFDGSSGMFTAQSYGLNLVNVYATIRGTEGTSNGYLIGSMKLKNKDSSGLQTWTLSAYTQIGNDSPMKLITYHAGTNIIAIGFAGHGEDKHEVGKIYYSYSEKEDIYKYLY